jgi:hypothetical protein
MLISRYGDQALKDRFLPGLTTNDMSRLTQGAQFMTEKEGGSDVGSLTTVAKFEDGQWRLYGEKWFCSNADAPVATLLARPEGAGPGTRGVGLFVMPRFLEDGRQNAYRIVRLKDKLGTRSMASGEIKFEGAICYPIGRLDRGFVQMAEMVNWSRLSNGVKSTALMRRALTDAMHVAHNRFVFGKLIIEQPLARRQMLKLMLPWEQALSLCFMTATALDRAEIHGSQEAAALLRILTPVLKFRSTRDARKMTGDALEMRGGIGYVEEFACARVLRDSYLGSIWEGTSNIVGIDAIGRAVKRHQAQHALAADLHQRIGEMDGVPQSWRDHLTTSVDRAMALAQTAAAPENEVESRRATSVLYHVASAVTLAWEGAQTYARRGDARRMILSRLVFDHRLSQRDPFALQNDAREQKIADLLLGQADVSIDDAREILAS